MGNNQLSAIDIISVLSFFLGLENLQENRQQSEHNDVQAANARQEQNLLEKIGRMFQEQNVILEEQNIMLREILAALKQ